MLTLLRGGTVLLREGFDADDVWRAIAEDGVTGLFLVPPLLYELLDHERGELADTSALRTVSYGGASTTPDRLLQAIDRFGPVLQQVYGMVEAGVIAALSSGEHDPARPRRLESCGRPVRVAEVRIRADERDLSVDEIGEIQVRGPLVTTGYWSRPELNSDLLRAGWLRTGDLGFLDEDGMLHIVDRMKDVIITGRHATTVPSRLVEDVLADHDLVGQAAVVGVADDRLGERIHAVVVPAHGTRLRPGLADALRSLVRSRLGVLYEPASVEVVSSLPLTPLGKVDKLVLRARALEGRSSSEGL
jgi:fatty-acyl-CoA synthase